MRVQVTQEDIDQGERGGSRDSCAVALALARKGVLTGGVQGRWAWVKGEAYLIAPEGRQWISNFDIGVPVGPITIRLDAPRRVK